MIEVLKQLVDALENHSAIKHPQRLQIHYRDEAIQAGKQAIAQLALDGKAENARELGLDYEQEPLEKFCDSNCVWTDHHPDCKLAQPEQEPVAWMDADGNVSDNNDHKCFPIPLYTHPPQRKPLTDFMVEMSKVLDNYNEQNIFIDGWLSAEAAHVIKE